jgi:hypothetical protein
LFSFVQVLYTHQKKTKKKTRQKAGSKTVISLMRR